MASFFPSEFKGIETREYSNELLKKLRLEVEQILTGISQEEAIGRHEKNMLLMDVPNNWNINVSGNMEVEMEVEFEKFLMSVAEHTTEDMDSITVFKFYSLIQYIKEKNVKDKKNGNN